MGSNKYYDANFNDNVSLEQEIILSNSERLSNVSKTSFNENVNTDADTHIRSFVWKFFDEKDNSSGPDKIIACKNLLSNSKLCTVTYAALGSTKEEEDYFEESDNNIDEIVNPITHYQININQPMSTEGIINQVKSIISQALNKYWDVPSEISLKASYLDSRFKNLLFTTREEKLKIEEILHNELQEMIESSSLITLSVSPNENSNTIINGK
ncbi:8259_t:CDS:2 [Funneliformis caledonium]|uniref:8259_t:CDS:1 n=1 Tax=Funneliformis caledonium TaxID=1117310 RepID=A0A9N9CDW5_9GLOM|nr:8259_t:CDS:2 [Funneliformis caledonium]